MISTDELTRTEQESLHRYYAAISSRDLSGDIMQRIRHSKAMDAEWPDRPVLSLIAVVAFIGCLVLGSWSLLVPELPWYLSLPKHISLAGFIYDALMLVKWLRALVVFDPSTYLLWLMIVVVSPLIIALNRLLQGKEG